VDICWN